MHSLRLRHLVTTLARTRGLHQSIPSQTRNSPNRQLHQSRPFSQYAQRQFSQSARLDYPRKDSQDKDSINTEATEYSKSGTDDASARQDEAAFDPNITDPGKQKDKAAEGNSVSPISFE